LIILLCLLLTLVFSSSLAPARAWAQDDFEVANDESGEGETAASDDNAANSKWPPYKFSRPFAADRGPGGYLSWWKLLLIWLLFLVWVKSTDWLSQDCQTHKLPYATWNMVQFLPFPITLLAITLMVPLFAVGLPALIIATFAPFTTYVIIRNGVVEPHNMVFTRDHLQHVFAEFLRKSGAEVKDKKKGHESGAQVTFHPQGAAEEKIQAVLVKARQAEGYLAAKDVIANAIDHNADKLMLDYTAESVSVRYQVDGVWHDGDALELEEGNQALQVIKSVSWLKPEERRARQEGRVDLTVNGKKYGCTIVCQGNKTGERVLLNFVGRKTKYNTLEELGMRDKMIEQLKGLMSRENGILIFSSMPGNGLSTTFNVALRSTDRFMRDFVLLEDKANPLEEVENVDPTRYDLTKGETPESVLPGLMRKEPDVIVIPEIPNAETGGIMCEAAKEEHLILTSIRAKEAVESLLRVLLLKIPAKEFAPVAIGVLNQRLVRKLCETCREAYEPPPALLQKMGIPAGRVDQLYRHPEEPEEVCPDCHGIGYRGRTAIYELLLVDDSIRDALIKQPKLEVLRELARRAGHRTLQTEGLVTVVKGVTSLPELMRVLKQ
jgi:type II secretory ATPase GspE/PulE/Tfp pilus assembly ATPase PilB-like protein